MPKPNVIIVILALTRFGVTCILRQKPRQRRCVFYWSSLFVPLKYRLRTATKMPTKEPERHVLGKLLLDNLQKPNLFKTLQTRANSTIFSIQHPEMQKKTKRALAQATLPTTNSKSPSKMGNACEMILSFLLGKFQPSSLAVSFRECIHPWLEIQLAPSGINAAIGGCSCTLPGSMLQLKNISFAILTCKMQDSWTINHQCPLIRAYQGLGGVSLDPHER